MDPRKVAARFVAFTCFLNLPADEPVSPGEAGRLAREHWMEFLSLSREELGEFLIGRAPCNSLDGSTEIRTTRRRNRKPELAASAV